jgi:hypothetical protein
MVDGFVRHAILLFLAMRIGDLVNVAAGMWFVPKYVKPEDIGAVLPITSFATFLSLPVFAFAMTVMKEAAYLAVTGERGRIKSLLCGVFVAVAAATVAVLGVTAILMPRFLELMRVSDGIAGFLVVAAAFLGCVAPVYTDALQSLKRFSSLAAIEVGGSLVRFLVMLAVMPVRALTGYFAGQAALPVFRIAGSVFMLRRDMSIRAESFWNRDAVRRITIAFGLILAYQAMPMAASLLEQTMIRTALPSVDSAGYYMVSRFADFLHYLTFPLLLVMFPYTVAAARKGENTCPYVIKCSAVTLTVSMLMAVAYAFFGEELLLLMPNGENYIVYVKYMPWLVLINALTTCQVFYANAEVSAGRFGFLWWFVPLHLIYMGLLLFGLEFVGSLSLPLMVACLGVISVLRFLFSGIACQAEALDSSRIRSEKKIDF